MKSTSYTLFSDYHIIIGGDLPFNLTCWVSLGQNTRRGFSHFCPGDSYCRSYISVLTSSAPR